MVKKRRRYPKEFKLEAVQLAVESDRTLAEVARDLGLAPSLLHKWKQQVDERDPAAAFPGNGTAAGPADEVRQLRRELERVKQERDFVKKAAVESTGRCNTLYSSTDSEGDLIAGSKNSHIATLVERQSRFTLLVKVAGKDTDTVVAALTKRVKNLPSELRRSLTWDRGMELAQHKRFTLATNLRVYFCDPQSPWQRGTNENTNRLLRQYFPKGTDLSLHSQAELNAVALRLNQRPRKTLGFCTPADTLHSSVALTG